MKLVMTLLARNEDDILERNICFHLNNGVDYIIATDNGSLDKTKEILMKYQKLGYLYYINEQEKNMKQDVWVSKMASIAIDEFGADYLIHCDADEFWVPNKGNLKDCIIKDKDLMFVNVINYLPPINGNFVNSKFIVDNGIICPDDFSKKNPVKFLLYKYHPKIVTSSKYRNIMKGNHMVITESKVERISNNDIFIHHFPIRSYNQFENKVIDGGLAVKERGDIDNNTSWQRKKWYKIYENGKLNIAYHKIGLFNNEKLYINKGILKKSIVPKSIRFAREIYFLKDFLRF